MDIRVGCTGYEKAAPMRGCQFNVLRIGMDSGCSVRVRGMVHGFAPEN